MGQHWKLDIEAPKAVHNALELDLLKQAVARNPDNTPLTVELARRLLVADQFSDVIELLEGHGQGESDFIQCSLLVQAYMSRETEDATRRAMQLAQRGVELAESDPARAHMLADIGKALTRLGDDQAALAALEKSLATSPRDRNAFKRLVALHLRTGKPGEIIVWADRLMAQGVAHSRLLASRVLAYASLGDFEAAREAEGLGTFLHHQIIDPPPGWDDLASFNAALAEELLRHPALRYDRYGTASTRTWRIDRPAMADAPLVGLLQQQIARQVEGFVTRHEGSQHPWFQARPPRGMLHNWCVITEADGLEEWHVHQNGWLSGSYYVSVPQAVQTGTSEAGCIAFGLPETLAGAEVAEGFGQHMLRPQPGLIALFPSHCYHRTYQHGTAERRICLAFDIWPN